MVIPNRAQLSRQRGSVFKKIDLQANLEIPKHNKTKEQTEEIMGFLRKNFLLAAM